MRMANDTCWGQLLGEALRDLPGSWLVRGVLPGSAVGGRTERVHYPQFRDSLPSSELEAKSSLHHPHPRVGAELTTARVFLLRFREVTADKFVKLLATCHLGRVLGAAEGSALRNADLPERFSFNPGHSRAGAYPTLLAGL
jgi:hypothetical protein